MSRREPTGLLSCCFVIPVFFLSFGITARAQQPPSAEAKPPSDDDSQAASSDPKRNDRTFGVIPNHSTVEKPPLDPRHFRVEAVSAYKPAGHAVRRTWLTSTDAGGAGSVLFPGVLCRGVCQAEPEPGGRASAAADHSSAPSSPVAGERPISWRLLVPNIVHDQRPIWLFPTAVARGRHLKPTLGFILATAGLVALDPHDTPYFRRTKSFADFNKTFSGGNTSLGMTIFPLAFYALGLAEKDSYAQRTSLLVGEAVADAELLTFVMKNIDRRLRPSDIPPGGDFAHTWFKSHGTLIGGRGSFPSGHTIAAFSVATVFANRYRRRRWAPWLAYGLAGLVGFSRLSLQSHFPSDVFAGGVLGYVISDYVVLRQH